MGKPRPPRGKARDPFRARGAEPLQNLEASLVRLYRRSRHPGRDEDPLFRSAQAGPVRSSERQEPHQPLDAWSRPLRQHGRRNRSRRGRTDQDLARFPHVVKPAPYTASRDRQTARPIERSRRRWVRDLDQARPSPSHAPSDRFSSRLARPQPTTARVRRPSRSAACFPAGSVAPRSAAATPRRAYGIPHGCGRARPDPCTPRCG
jgi:hypothetical protein